MRIPRSPSPLPPFPVMTSTSRASRTVAARRKRKSAVCASRWVSPCKSRRPSIGSLPRATRVRLRRQSAARGGDGLLPAGSASCAFFAEGISICGAICSAVSTSSEVSESRSGAIDFVIAVHNTRSSAERTRRRLPSPGFIKLMAPLGRLCRHASGRARTGRCCNDHFRARHWKRCIH